MNSIHILDFGTGKTFAFTLSDIVLIEYTNAAGDAVLKIHFDCRNLHTLEIPYNRTDINAEKVKALVRAYSMSQGAVLLPLDD